MQAVIEERGGFVAVVIRDASDQIGVVTVHDGPALTADQIIAPEVGTDQAEPATFHNSFQDPEKFIAAGGRRGRQLQVLVEGSYFINRLFATVEMVPKTIIDVGHVGVVISYTGDSGADTSGEEYRHGELVDRGTRGVWSEPLLPGKYAFNTYAGKVLVVPTTNFILKWDQELTGQHKFDENLSEVSLITKDAFEPTLPLSVVVHIDYRKAPLVVQRFGDIKKLVEQTLDPMVSAYFKNVAQKHTLIELLQERTDIQAHAGEEMRAKFGAYNLELQEVLIGTPRAAAGNDQIEKVLQQLRERQLAEEQVTHLRQAEGRGPGREGAARGAIARPPADRDHRIRALDHRPGEPGQGRGEARHAGSRADPHPRQGGGRPHPHRRRGRGGQDDRARRRGGRADHPHRPCHRRDDREAGGGLGRRAISAHPPGDRTARRRAREIGRRHRARACRSTPAARTAAKAAAPSRR